MTARNKPEKRKFGEITLLSTGRYRARYRGPDGARHNARVTFLSRLDAETWLSAQHRKLSAGEWKPPALAAAEVATVEEYARTSIARRRLRPGTVALYDKLLRLEIIPTFGDHRVRDVTTADVTDWYNAMNGRPTQQANAYGLFKSIMKDAVDEQIIERNPCRVKGGVNKQAVHEIKVLTTAQLGRYLDAVPAARRVPLLLAGWCGLRSGEIRGLRVQDLDVKAGVVHVRRGIVRLTGGLIVQPPKTAAGVRDVAIPPHLLPALRIWMEAQPQRDPEALLFPASDGVTALNDSVLRDAHYKGRKAIKMPHLTIHDLRHTSATMAAQQGATIAELQARIGHSTPNMALRYQHVAAHRDKSLAKRISEMAKQDADKTGESDSGEIDLIDHKPRKPQSKPSPRPGRHPSRSASQSGRSQRTRAAAIRAWAAKHGYELAPTGRINKDVIAAYEAAHTGSQRDLNPTSDEPGSDPTPTDEGSRRP